MSLSKVIIQFIFYIERETEIISSIAPIAHYKFDKKI